MTVESELKKLTGAVEALTAVLANAALGTTGAATQLGTVASVAAAKTLTTTVGEPGIGAAGGPGAKVAGAGATVSGEVVPGIEQYADAANSSADEIRARVTPLVQSHGQEVFQEALSAMGFSMLSELTPDRYPEFLARIAATIGAGV
jgi:hypothetical protein